MGKGKKEQAVQADLDASEQETFERLKKDLGLRRASEVVRFAIFELARRRGVLAAQPVKEASDGGAVSA